MLEAALHELGSAFHEDLAALGRSRTLGSTQGSALRLEPYPVTLAAGTEHRFRIININPDLTADVSLVRDSVTLPWRALAQDGADLPPALRAEGPARVRTGTGETYDFAWTPSEPGDAMLLVRFPFATDPGELLLRQPLRVR